MESNPHVALLRSILDKLPFNLKVRITRYTISSDCKCSLSILATKDLSKIKPYLRDMELLIEPILEGGKLPILELAKLAMPVQDIPDDFFDDTNIYIAEGGIHVIGKVQFHLNIENCYFGVMAGNVLLEVSNYTKLVDLLDKWHFNRRNLDKELYISIPASTKIPTDAQ